MILKGGEPMSNAFPGMLYQPDCNCSECETFRKANTPKWEDMGYHGVDIPFAQPVSVVPKPALREYTSDERKAMPVYSGALMYFPDAIAAVSRVSKKSNAKHNGPDAPLGWSRGKSTDQMDAATRHIMEPNAADADSGEIELAHAAWRILAQLQLAEEARLRKAGIKPFSGVIA